MSRPLVGEVPSKKSRRDAVADKHLQPLITHPFHSQFRRGSRPTPPPNGAPSAGDLGAWSL